VPIENSYRDFIIVCTGAHEKHEPRTLATFARQVTEKMVWDVKEGSSWDEYGLSGGTSTGGRVMGLPNARAYSSKEHEGVVYHRFECPRCNVPRLFTDAEMGDRFTTTRRDGLGLFDIAN
jgi:hypothetical protein